MDYSGWLSLSSLFFSCPVHLCARALRYSPCQVPSRVVHCLASDSCDTMTRRRMLSEKGPLSAARLVAWFSTCARCLTGSTVTLSFTHMSKGLPVLFILKSFEFSLCGLCRGPNFGFVVMNHFLL